MVPNVGDYHTLAWTDHAKMLVRNAGGVELLSNVCRHRQAIMLEGRGNAENIVCPLHRWTYDLKASCSARRASSRSPASARLDRRSRTWNASSSPGREIAQGPSQRSRRWRLGLQRLRADPCAVDEYHIN